MAKNYFKLLIGHEVMMVVAVRWHYIIPIPPQC